MADVSETNDTDTDPAAYVPGTFGCHEAMHMASVAMEMVDRHLCEHPAIKGNEAWFHLAGRAFDALFELYQAIGAEHMKDD